jgi:hypothetical protein
MLAVTMVLALVSQILQVLVVVELVLVAMTVVLLMKFSLVTVETDFHLIF